MLNTVSYDGPGDVPLLIAHGLFGSARNWNVIARRLSQHVPVLAVDMRNHGFSFHDPVHTYVAMADDLAQVIAAHGGRAHVLGHSMGGKAAMVLALGQPELVAQLVVVDIAPMAYAHSQLPMVDAMQAVDLSTVVRRSDADAQLSASVPEAALRAFLLQSLDLGTTPAAWRLNLPALAAQMPDIMGFPDVSGRYVGPTSFICGQRSDYVRPEHDATIRGLFPQVEFTEIANAGHWVHAEAPEPFLTALVSKLRF